MRHNKDIMSAWGYLWYLTLDKRESSWQYINRSSSQPFRCILKLWEFFWVQSGQYIWLSMDRYIQLKLKIGISQPKWVCSMKLNTLVLKLESMRVQTEDPLNEGLGKAVYPQWLPWWQLMSS